MLLCKQDVRENCYRLGPARGLGARGRAGIAAGSGQAVPGPDAPRPHGPSHGTRRRDAQRLPQWLRLRGSRGAARPRFPFRRPRNPTFSTSCDASVARVVVREVCFRPRPASSKINDLAHTVEVPAFRSRRDLPTRQAPRTRSARPASRPRPVDEWSPPARHRPRDVHPFALRPTRPRPPAAESAVLVPKLWSTALMHTPDGDEAARPTTGAVGRVIGHLRDFQSACSQREGRPIDRFLIYTRSS